MGQDKEREALTLHESNLELEAKLRASDKRARKAPQTYTAVSLHSSSPFVIEVSCDSNSL